MRLQNPSNSLGQYGRRRSSSLSWSQAVRCTLRLVMLWDSPLGAHKKIPREGGAVGWGGCPLGLAQWAAGVALELARCQARRNRQSSGVASRHDEGPGMSIRLAPGRDAGRPSQNEREREEARRILTQADILNCARKLAPLRASPNLTDASAHGQPICGIGITQWLARVNSSAERRQASPLPPREAASFCIYLDCNSRKYCCCASDRSHGRAVWLIRMAC